MQKYYSIIILLFVIGLVVTQTHIQAYAKSVQDLIDQNQQNQTYGAELLSYILSHNTTESAGYDKASDTVLFHQIPITQALNKSGIYLNSLTLEQLESIVKENIAGGSVWSSLSDIIQERRAPALDTLKDALNLK